MNKTNNIVLISILSFAFILALAICADYKRGVFDFAIGEKSRKKVTKISNNYRKNNYKNNLVSSSRINRSKHNSVKIGPSGLPLNSRGAARKLVDEEVLHSNAKTAYFNYLAYSIKQNLPDMSGFFVENSLWLIMDIDKNGRVIAYDFYNYNGPEGLKDAVVSALSKTAPFQPLPEEYQGNVFKAILVFSNGGRYIGQGSIYNPPEPQLKLAQARKTNTLKVTDVKLASCNGTYPGNLSHEMSSYVHKLHKQIQSNWKPVRTEPNDVRLSYLVDKNGKISEVNIGYSKGPIAAENAAKNAILSLKAPRFPESENIENLRLNHYFEVEENKIYK